MATRGEQISQGAAANKAGKAYEKLLRPVFEEYGYTIETYSKWKKAKRKYAETTKLALKNVPFPSIYNHTGRTEWLLVDKDRGTEVRVEVKTQRKSGSVDEKFPYMYLTAAICYPEDDVILLVEGNGFKKGARPWLQKAIDERWMLPEDSKKNITMMSLSEFIDWFIAENS